MEKTRSHSEYIGYLLILSAGLIFGTFEVVSKKLSGIDPLQLNFLRFLFGGLSLMPFAIAEAKSRKSRLSHRDIMTMLFLGALFINISMVLLQVGLTKVPASQTAFVFAANPVIIAVLAAVILKETANWYTIVALLLGIAGIAVIADPFSAMFDSAVLYPMSSVVLFGLYIVLARKLTKKFGTIIVTTAAMLLGVLPLGLYLTATGLPPFASIPIRDLPLLLYIGVFCSGIAYVTYFKGMELTSTNTGSLTFFIKPVVATVLSILVLGEQPGLSLYLGAALIILGSAVMVVSRNLELTRLRGVQNHGHH